MFCQKTESEDCFVIDTLLFDLDGTLVPYWQDAYLSTYLKSVAAVFVRAGYEPKPAVKALMESCYAMIKNDGSRTNRDAFFADFRQRLGEEVLSLEPALDAYYRTDFSVVKTACGEERDCRPLIDALRQKGYRLVVATNPLFPLCAIETRLSWVGLVPEDFAYITVYDNSRFCKPNIDYYRDLLDTLGVRADRCLMIGNNIAEDMIAEKAGMKVFLMPRCLINKNGEDVSKYPCGSFSELLAYIESFN